MLKRILIFGLLISLSACTSIQVNNTQGFQTKNINPQMIFLNPLIEQDLLFLIMEECYHFQFIIK